MHGTSAEKVRHLPDEARDVCEISQGTGRGASQSSTTHASYLGHVRVRGRQRRDNAVDRQRPEARDGGVRDRRRLGHHRWGMGQCTRSARGSGCIARSTRPAPLATVSTRTQGPRDRICRAFTDSPIGDAGRPGRRPVIRAVPPFSGDCSLAPFDGARALDDSCDVGP